jgi:hypothetical protein
MSEALQAWPYWTIVQVQPSPLFFVLIRFYAMHHWFGNGQIPKDYPIWRFPWPL